ncbi:hypothetical protein MPLA_380034 [Mesorhizobium sp. ORS 3359]|nr:hypothetical protein MPLA_380034 [Mesorhizobium sp. ORS 3359]
MGPWRQGLSLRRYQPRRYCCPQSEPERCYPLRQSRPLRRSERRRCLEATLRQAIGHRSLELSLCDLTHLSHVLGLAEAQFHVAKARHPYRGLLDFGHRQYRPDILRAYCTGMAIRERLSLPLVVAHGDLDTLVNLGLLRLSLGLDRKGIHLGAVGHFLRFPCPHHGLGGGGLVFLVMGGLVVHVVCVPSELRTCAVDRLGASLLRA